MATLTIDDETFAALGQQAAARGLTIDAWLKRNLVNQTIDNRNLEDLSILARLSCFDELTRSLEQRNIGSGGSLDDSREAIYGDRGVSAAG